MPRIVVAVAAVAAFAAVTAVAGPIVAGALAGPFLAGAAPVITSLLGAVVAAGVSYAGSSVLGLNKPPKAAAAQSSTASAQDRRQMIRSSVAPRQVVYGRARVSGPLIYAASSGDTQEYLHVVVPLATHLVAGLDAVWINDHRIVVNDLDVLGKITTGPLTDKAWVRFQTGGQTAAQSELVAESPDGWAATAVGNGVAYIYVKMLYDQDAFPSGLQNVGAEIRGCAEVFDPRTGLYGYSDNPALCILHYLRSSFGLACEADEVDLPSFIAAANICDEAVQIRDNGDTQLRYQLGGSFTLDRTPLDIIEEMQGSCAGQVVYVQGRYRMYAGAYSAPTDTLTVSDLAGDIDLQTKTPRRELFNSIRGTFIDPNRNWQAADFFPISDPTYVAEDDGEVIWKDIELPFTTDGVMAQRMALLALRRSREMLTVRAPVRYAGLRYAVWQMLSVTIADFGWDAKPFRITALTFEGTTGIVTLTLREESAFSYAWHYDEAAAQGPAPDTTLVSPFRIPAPAGLAVASELYVNRSGDGVKTRAIVTWSAAAHPFVSGYDVQIRAASDPNGWWTPTVTAGELRAFIDDVFATSYVIRVRARSLVAVGQWAEIATTISDLAADPPADVTGLAVQTIGGLAFLRWDQHPDIDVRAGGWIEFRHTSDSTSPTWVGSTSIGDAVPGAATQVLLPLKPGTYLAKARDAGGRRSENAALIRTVQATALTFANVTTLTEHTGFSGAKTNTVVTSSTLRLDTSGDVDSETDWDAIPDLDGLGGVLPAGSYAFSGGIDLTTVRPIRLTANIKATAVNTLDQVDDRAATVDDWLSWDGAVGGEADAWVEVRETPDNPAGSPTWSDWRRLDQAEFRNRAFQLRAQLRSSDPAFNIHVAELSVTADEVS